MPPVTSSRHAGHEYDREDIAEMPFLANIDYGDDRGSRRFYDPWDAHQDELAEAAGEQAAHEAEAAGTAVPPRDTEDGRIWRVIHRDYEKPDHPMAELGEAFEGGYITVGAAIGWALDYLKEWPGSIRGWDMLGYLNYELAFGNEWKEPVDLETRRAAAREALRAYETGVAIGQRAMPAKDNAFIQYGWWENRPFHRCLYQLANLYWRQDRTDDAIYLFTALLNFNPNDNVGARYELAGILARANANANEEDWFDEDEEDDDLDW